MGRKHMSNTKKTTIVSICLAAAVILLAGAFYGYYTQYYFIKVNGDPSVTISLDGTYHEAGATAVVNGKNVSGEIKITSNLDVSKPGSYRVSYTYQRLKAERDLTVSDKMNPVLTLATDKPVKVKLGEPYNGPQYSAVDENGKDITGRVRVSNTDFKKTGKYQVSYMVTDDRGNRTTRYETVRVLPNTDYPSRGLPICMYHYIYDAANPPADLYRRYGNYIEIHELDAELNYLVQNHYYFPTWKEVRAYVDGKLLLPDKSIVLTFDDGASSFFTLGIPALEKYQVPATSFLITKNQGAEKVKKYQSKWVTYQSHSNNMHRPGGFIGHGGIMTNLPEAEVLADLRASINICGSSDAFNYPFGDYTQETRDMVKKAGFLCAVTTQYGKVYPGNDPYLLDRVRMVMGQSLNGFISGIQ